MSGRQIVNLRLNKIEPETLPEGSWVGGGGGLGQQGGGGCPYEVPILRHTKP